MIAKEPAGRAAGRRLAVLLCSLALAATLGCRTFDVRSDWDAARAFDTDRRFFFVEPPSEPVSDPFADNSLLRKRVRSAIEATLLQRGFELTADRAEADLLVTYHVVLEERMRVDGVSSTTGIGYYNRPLGVGTAQSTARVRPYQESTLVIDFLDPASEELVWRGWGTGMLGTRSRERGPERLAAGVLAILAEFPPNPPAESKP
jgi:hypothetical protein